MAIRRRNTRGGWSSQKIAAVAVMSATIYLLWRSATRLNGLTAVAVVGEKERIASATARDLGGETSARGAGKCTEKLLARLRLSEKLQSKYRALVWTISDEDARARGAALDALPAFSRGPLHCSVFVIKDNIDFNGAPTTAGSRVFQKFPPPRKNAVVIDNLISAGAVILAKANLDEFALGYKTMSSVIGQTRNAVDPSLFPGGSSGGSAVAVALGIADVALGTDTGGSIRIPAAFNQIYGLRPTHGLTSLQGVVPLSHSRDTVGPLAKSPHDIAAALGAILAKPQQYSACTQTSSHKFKIGSLKELHKPRGKRSKKKSAEAEHISKVVTRALDATETIIVLNMHVPEIKRGELSRYKSASWYEFADDIARYLANADSGPIATLQDIFDATDDANTKLRQRLRDRIAFSQDASVYKYKRQVVEFPQRVRSALLRAMDDRGVDAVAFPSYTAYPGRIASHTQPFCENNRLSAMTGLPSIVVPLGSMSAVELVARPRAECDLISIAQLFYERFHSSAA